MNFNAVPIFSVIIGLSRIPAGARPNLKYG